MQKLLERLLPTLQLKFSVNCLFSFCLLASASLTADAATMRRSQRSLQPVELSQRTRNSTVNQQGGNSKQFENRRYYVQEDHQLDRNSQEVQSDDSNHALCQTTKAGRGLSYVICLSPTSFCCGISPAQYCCSSEEFYRSQGEQKSNSKSYDIVKRIGVLVIGLACSLVFSCCLCLIVCLCIVQPKWRKRTAGRSLQRPSQSERTWRLAGSEISSSTITSKPPPSPPPLQPQVPLSLRLPPPPPPPYSPPAGGTQ